MKAVLKVMIVLGLVHFTVLPGFSQFNTIKYVSHGYFVGMDFSEKQIIEQSSVITIDQNRVRVLKIDLSNPENDTLIFESRMLSALKYPTLDGDQYYVWKLGDRKMVLRKKEGVKLLSLYQTDEYGLPKEYVTYLIKD